MEYGEINVLLHSLFIIRNKMKSKQTLAVGQRYRVIKDINNFKVGNILTIKKISTIFPKTDFMDTNGYCWNIKEDPIQLLPKKEVKKWKTSRIKAVLLLEACAFHTTKKGFGEIVEISEKDFQTFKTDLLAEQSTPKKKSKEIKEIKEIDLPRINTNFSSIEQYEWAKQVTDTINLLIKNK